MSRSNSCASWTVGMLILAIVATSAPTIAVASGWEKFQFNGNTAFSNE